MGYIVDMVREEMRRLEALEHTYRDQLASLPEGTLCIKKRRGRDYVYVAVRDRGVLRFRYVAPATSPKGRDIIGEMARKRQTRERLRETRSNLREVRSLLRGRK